MADEDKPALGAIRRNRSYQEEAARLKAEREADPAYTEMAEYRARVGITNPEPSLEERGAPPTPEELEQAWNAAARAGGLHREQPEPDPDHEPMSDDPIRGLIQVQGARVANGWDFIHSVTEDIESVWGQGDEVLWAKGEPCLLVGPSGVGKSTLTQQVMKAHFEGGEVLRHPVAATPRRVLYLAMDRPAQIARSMGRMFGADWETRLKDKLVVWRGPLPFSLVKQPEALAIMCDELGASSVFVDSLKDLAPKISDEEAGSQINAAFQIAIVAGVEVFGIHHQRKAQGENKKPNKLSDVYGSQMLVNGAGSVILLWGEPGDPVVELSHLKQPMEQVGPYIVTHDHYAGVSEIDDYVDAAQAIEGAHKGVDAVYVARAMFGTTDPSRSDVEKARRRLDKLVRDGRARVEAGDKGGSVESRRPTMWFPVDEIASITALVTNHGPITVFGSDDKTAGQAITGNHDGSITAQSRETQNRRSGNHGSNHDQSRSNHANPSPLQGEEGFAYPRPRLVEALEVLGL